MIIKTGAAVVTLSKRMKVVVRLVVAKVEMVIKIKMNMMIAIINMTMMVMMVKRMRMGMMTWIRMRILPPTLMTLMTKIPVAHLWFRADRGT